MTLTLTLYLVIRVLAVASCVSALVMMVMVNIATWRLRHAPIPVPTLTVWHVALVSLFGGGYLLWSIYEVSVKLLAHPDDVAPHLSPLVLLLSLCANASFLVIYRMLLARRRRFDA